MECLLRWTDDRGFPLGPAGQCGIKSMTATRIANDIGTFVAVVLPPYDPALLRRDNMVQVWYRSRGGALRLWRVYFVRRWRWQTVGGSTELEVGGVCCNDLLRRRVIAAPTDIPRGEARDDTADNLMRAKVRTETSEASIWTITADYGSRAWSAFGVEADIGASPRIDLRALSYKPLLERGGGGVLNEIAEAAKEAGGERLYFDVTPDVVSAGDITFTLRIYRRLPGVDRTTSGVAFSLEAGTIRQATLEYDYTAEVNNLYYGRVGWRSEVRIKQEYSAEDIDASRWNRCEAYAGDIGVAEAMRELRKRLGKRRFTATLADTPACRFGEDWGFGDLLPVSYQGQRFGALVRAVTWQIDQDGQATVSARLDSEDWE